MTACCGEQVVLHRITSEGQAQVSTDGGVTWTQDPADPRVNVPAVPPVVVPDGISAACQSAQNESDQFKSIQQTFGVALDFEAGVLAVAGAIVAICAAILLDPTHIFTLVPLIIHEAGQLLHETNEEYNGQFTDTEYRDLICIFIDHVESDGTYTEDDYEAIKADINTKFADRPIPRNTFLIILALSGVGGLNFFATLTTNPVAEDDCGGCACDVTQWELSFPAEPKLGKIVSRNFGAAKITMGSDAINDDGRWYVDIRTPDADTCCTVDSYVITAGDIDQAAWQDCGSTFDPGGLTVGLIVGHNVNHIQFRGVVPFELVVKLT